jgi:hypothetical protein
VHLQWVCWVETVHVRVVTRHVTATWLRLSLRSRHLRFSKTSLGDEKKKVERDNGEGIETRKDRGAEEGWVGDGCVVQARGVEDRCLDGETQGRREQLRGNVKFGIQPWEQREGFVFFLAVIFNKTRFQTQNESDDRELFNSGRELPVLHGESTLRDGVAKGGGCDVGYRLSLFA